MGCNSASITPAMSLSRWWRVRWVMPSRSAVFLLVPVFAMLAGLAVLSIPREAINLGRARDLDGAVNEKGAAAPAGYGVLLTTRPLVIFGLCVMLFHFANAPLLPLIGKSSQPLIRRQRQR
jgi:hypothetical protein